MSGGRRTDGGHSFEDGSPASSGCEDRPDCEARSIGLFELTWHPQNLRELCRIVDAEADDVTVFTSEGIREDWFADADLELDKYEWMLRGDDESLASYFRRVKEYCNRHIDFLMVVTPFGSGVHTSHFVEFDPDCASACWIYNAQACIESTESATEARHDLREVAPRLRRALVPEDRETAERSLKPFRYYVRPYVLENYDAHVVEYPPIREHLDAEWDWSRPVYDFAPYVYRGVGDAESGAGRGDPRPDEDGEDDPVPAERDGPIHVTVSGRVVENVRDYDRVLDVFEDLFDEYGDDVALDVLGRPVGGYGEHVMERCRALDERGHPVNYYPDADWIPTEEFDRVVARSNVLLNPIYLSEETTRAPAPDEIRGTTKGTGVLFDALKHGTPLALPEGFTVAPMIEGATVTFDSNAELRAILKRLLDDPTELADLEHAARRNAAEYVVEKQRERFDTLVADVLARS